MDNNMDSNNMRNGSNRRQFLKHSALGIIGAGVMGAAPLDAQENQPKIKEYRTLGRTGFKASDIGIGSSRQHESAVMSMLLDSGVNYIDTAESYGRGTSETNVGKAIKGRNRKELFITTKLHLAKDETKDKILARFRKSLERLDTDYVDCLMMHSADSVEMLKMKSFHDAVAQLKREGKLRFAGVSNHGARYRDIPDLMEKVLTAAAADNRFDVVLVVYNFLQKDQGKRILTACKAKNIGTTIMKSNPVGRYYSMKERVEKLKKEGKELEARMREYFQRLSKTATQAEAFIKEQGLKNPGEIRDAAIRFVLNDPDAHVLNLAVSNFGEAEEILNLSGSRLNQKDKDKLAAFSRGCGQLYCRHACGLCQSQCPHNVPVNTIMRYNHYFDAHGAEKYAMQKYHHLKDQRADKCLDCPGGCENACPHGVPIQALLVMAHHQLGLA